MDGSQHSLTPYTVRGLRNRFPALLLAMASLCVPGLVRAQQAILPKNSGPQATRRPAESTSSLGPERLKYADECVRPQLKYAFTLADRGAVYSAKARFIDCLRTVARVLDSEQPNPMHEQSLLWGLTALRESDEFSRLGPTMNRVSIERLAHVHKTPILKQADLARLTPAEALRAYYFFAQRHLVAAVGSVPAASEALYGMARIEAYRSAQDGLTTSTGSAKALLLHQAALAVDAENFSAANEIGVILARSGRLDESRQVLEHSIRVRPQAESWHNLAAVYEKLGDLEKAGFARRKHEELTQAHYEGRNGKTPASGTEAALVRWVDAEEFAAGGVDPDCTVALRNGISPPVNAARDRQQDPHAPISRSKNESAFKKTWAAVRERFQPASRQYDRSRQQPGNSLESRNGTTH